MTNEFRFFYPLQVRYVETDAQGHVFFSHYLTYFDIGLTEYIRNLSFSYKDMLALGVDMFYVDAHCQYKGRAFFDDTLNVNARIARFGTTSFSFEFAIAKADSNELVATGDITAVTVDRKTWKPVRVPEALRQAVAEFEGQGQVLQ
jgi:acyl-CoA thioester hydrolase